MNTPKTERPLRHSLIVRPYAPADYDDFVRLDTTTQSKAFWSEADWHPIHPPCAETPDARRYVAVASGQVVGYGAVLWATSSNLDVLVHPAAQRQGVGTLLWERMRQDLSALGPVAVGPWVRAENTAACRWLESLGFVPVHRDGPVQLQVPDADPVSSDSFLTALAPPGIVLTTLASEKASDPDCLAKFCALYAEVGKDVPGASSASPTTTAQCLEELAQPGVLPESVFVAKAGAAYVGLSILGRRVTPEDLRFGGPDSLSQHLTGVRADFRRRGIARALKRCTIAYAQRHGFRRILTNSDNPAMRALNYSLGFRAGPWLIYSFTEHTPSQPPPS